MLGWGQQAALEGTVSPVACSRTEVSSGRVYGELDYKRDSLRDPVGCKGVLPSFTKKRQQEGTLG